MLDQIGLSSDIRLIGGIYGSLILAGLVLFLARKLKAQEGMQNFVVGFAFLWCLTTVF